MKYDEIRTIKIHVLSYKMQNLTYFVSFDKIITKKSSKITVTAYKIQILVAKNNIETILLILFTS